jgi:DNA-directed RNA polymerase specialized sigma24 family protein
MLAYQNEDYELFRRAIMERDADAWTAIHRRYRALLIAWASRYGSAARLGELPEDIADQAFARAWMALTPQHFATFAGLAQLLAYLRTCVATTVIDGARSQLASERRRQQIHERAVATPEQIVVASMAHVELWRMLKAMAQTPAEEVILVESIAYALPPREILARHPQLFCGIADVYSAKRNLFARLQRNHDLLRLHQELSSI